MPQGRENLSGGRAANFCGEQSVVQLMNEAGLDGYDFIVTCMSHPRCCLDINELVEKAREMSGDAGEMTPKRIINEVLPEMTIADTTLLSQHWSRLVVGRISPWIDPDSDNPYIRLLSEKSLTEELAYFAYLSIPAVLIPIRGKNSGNLARIILNTFVKLKESSFAIWTQVPITAPRTAAVDGTSANDTSNDTSVGPNVDTSTWHWFYNFRRSCNNHHRIMLALEMTPDLPESQLEIARWKGEQLVALVFNTSTFLNTSSGLPILSLAHRKLTKEFFMFHVQCIVDGPKLHHPKPSKRTMSAHASTETSEEGSSGAEGAHGAEGERRQCAYYSHLDSVWQNRPSRNMDAGALGYDDRLQIPLQPLRDNLASMVYESFECDSVKYEQYGQAVEAAIGHKESNWSSQQTMVVMVLGAGRGPLVDVAYTVLNRKNLKFKLYAVEKNKCAVVTLKAKNASVWNNEVTVVYSDMRKFQPEEKADIVISELLGSFGDNELSPECLDGALHLMKDDCISIPSSYRSYIAPLHSPRLYNEIRSVAQRETERNPMRAFECPYVVRLFNHFEIARPKELFRFEHPNFQQKSNDRFVEVNFIAKESSELIGLGGYFFANLFGNFTLSIVPRYETPGLCSWFPILFPFEAPVFVKKGERIRVRFWRLSNHEHVWYQWQLVEPRLTALMNPRGRAYAMRLM